MTFSNAEMRAFPIATQGANKAIRCFRRHPTELLTCLRSLDRLWVWCGETEKTRSKTQTANELGRPSPEFLKEREESAVKNFKIVVEKHPDAYVAYPLGVKGVVVGQGETYEAAVADVTSAIRFHLETFGADALDVDPPVLEAFIAEAGVPG